MAAGTLASLSNSIFASLSLPGCIDELGIGESPFKRECLVLIDGMGSLALKEYGEKFSKIGRAHV